MEKYKNNTLLLPKIFLTERQLCDLELITNGGFYPLDGFLNEDDYNSVVSKMRLKNGSLWPIPVILDVKDGNSYRVGQEVLLCDNFEKPLAVLKVGSVYCPDRRKEALSVYGTSSREHFGVRYLLDQTQKYYLGGKVLLINDVERLDFKNLRKTPSELKREFKKSKWKKIIAFQTRNPIHQAHFWLIKQAAEKYGAKVLIHPAVGPTKDGDIDYITRVRCYEVISKKYAKDFVKVCLLPLAMRMAGPREAVLHAIIRKNYGCTHFIVGRAHADPGVDSGGKAFYDPFDAQKLVLKYAKEIGIEIIAFPEMAYDEEKNEYVTLSGKNKKYSHIKRISGTEFRRMLRNHEKVPEWFSFPEVIRILREKIDREKGFTVFFTGLPCSGKSTIAKALTAKLLEDYGKQVTLLDGDVVRKHLSRGLGFSEEDRRENIRRIGFVASEIVKHGGIAVCAAISPYGDVRREIKDKINANGSFIEVYLSTPIEICKMRDTKELYKKAELGIIKNVTGVDDKYEVPKNPTIILDTSKFRVNQCIDKIVEVLRSEKLVA